MTKHDFSPLYDQYPIIIEQMEDNFTSHEFILKLAQQKQTQYIEALYAYRYYEYGEQSTPFMTVHGILAKKLKSFPDVIKIVRNEAPSEDIFRNSNPCTQWKKVN